MQLALPVSAASLDDLLNAAKLGDAREVAELVAKGMDPNASDQSGNTLLILAAREEQPAVVAELIKQRGVKLDARNAAGDSALMLAALPWLHRHRRATAQGRRALRARGLEPHALRRPSRGVPP